MTELKCELMLPPTQTYIMSYKIFLLFSCPVSPPFVWLPASCNILHSGDCLTSRIRRLDLSSPPSLLLGLLAPETWLLRGLLIPLISRYLHLPPISSCLRSDPPMPSPHKSTCSYFPSLASLPAKRSISWLLFFSNGFPFPKLQNIVDKKNCFKLSIDLLELVH